MSLWNTVKDLWSYIIGALKVTRFNTSVMEIENVLNIIEGEHRDTETILIEMLTEVGIEKKYIDNRILPAYIKWYKGENNEEDIKNSIIDFAAANKGINRNIANNLKDL